MKKYFAALMLVSLLAAITIYTGNDFLIGFESEESSKSVGEKNNGRLINGKRLPSSGPNFRTYSRFGSLIGRTGVHDRVRDTILMAYRTLDETHPERVFVYGETGWLWGGRFRPHRTHQNGLSVDFMVPVTRNDQSVYLPTHPFNKWGYALSFSSEGRSEDLQIDFEAMAAHLHALITAGQGNGLSIELVVFAPNLQQHLFNTELGEDLRESLRFNVNPSWVRHDDHYHVDFRIDHSEPDLQLTTMESE